MEKSVKIRKIIFEILYEIYSKNINFEKSFLNFSKSNLINEQERSMIYNVVLNSIRNYFFINNILNKFLKKKTSVRIKILLLSAITQILYLDFKDYAVTNDTVEVAKIKKLNPGLINSLIKNLIKERKLVNKTNIDQSNIPKWFMQESKKNKLNIKNFFKEISMEPSLHLVFKEKKFIKEFNEEYFKTTERSLFVLNKKKIKDIQNYTKGHWWIQDFSSMLPIYLSPEFKSKKILDMCSAPGGKAFQALSLSAEVSLNDFNKSRIKILRQNLKRLNYTTNITTLNALEIPENKNFDVIILDAPCSGIGTIRRNPEILFKKKPPDIDSLVITQTNLINKASKLLKKKGILIYMVCSFFHKETKIIKNNFLKENINFSHSRFKLKNSSDLKTFIDVDGDIFCIPMTFKNYLIDGFYAVKFIKND